MQHLVLLSDSSSKQFGVIVAPLSLNYDGSRLLVNELETNELECLVR
jgi:hypothetical protein